MVMSKGVFPQSKEPKASLRSRCYDSIGLTCFRMSDYYIKGIITGMLAALALSDILRWEIPFVCLELRRVCQQHDKFYSHSEIAS